MTPAATNTPTTQLHCRHFGTCGGCEALDTPIETQIRRKRASIETMLAPFTRGVRMRYTLPPREPQHDRNRLLWPTTPDQSGELTAGLFARGSHDLVTIEECAIQDPIITSLGIEARRVLRDLGVRPYDEGQLAAATESGDCLMRAIRVRVCASTREVSLGLFTTTGTLPRQTEFVGAMRSHAATIRSHRGRAVRLVGILREVEDTPGNTMFSRTPPTVLFGRDHQFDRVAGRNVRVSWSSFLQTHRHAEQVLFTPALRMLGPIDGQKIVDGFAGIGAFGLRLATAGAAEVTMVEEHESAVRDAAWNARHALSAEILDQSEVKLIRAPFAQAELPRRPDALLVDPPRRGLESEGVEAVLRCQPRRLLIVSCAPEALARDLALLHSSGYRVVKLRLVDLFPHTSRAEVLTLLHPPKRKR